MKVLMVTRDTGPWLALEKVGGAFYEQGILFSMPHTFKLYNADPPGVSVDQVSKLVTDEGMGFDVVVTGMSSSPELAKEELAACDAAVKNGVPLALFADTFRSWARPWFELYRQAASALFVVSPAEAERARELFPHAKIVASGNPTWEDFFFPKYTREEVKAKLGLDSHDSMILVPGSKSLVVNILLFGGVIGVVNNFFGDDYFKIVVSLHPGDPNPPKLYNDLVRYSSNSVRLITRDVMSGSDMIPGCDIVVESASTIGVEAACQRIPVVEYFTYAGQGNLERQTGSAEYTPCDLGIASEVLDDLSDLARTMASLLSESSSDRQRMNRMQEFVFPKPAEKGAAAQTIINALQELCR